MASNVKRRETLSNQILEQIDSGPRTVMVIKDVPLSQPLSYRGDVPFWKIDLPNAHAPDETDPAAEPVLVAEFKDMRLKLSKRTAPMPYTRRHIDADEIFFIHRGKARILTEVGEMEAPTGRFVFIGKGVAYRIVPETDDFMALIVESEEPVEMSELCSIAELEFLQPVFPLSKADSDGQTEWEERMTTSTWSVNVIRDYDPILTTQIVGDAKPIFAIDAEIVPVHNPQAPSPGLPFDLFQASTFAFALSKRASSMPFYHRNTRRNEVFFVHVGDCDQDTDLGYISAPCGTIACMPKGIEHSPTNRKPPIVNLLFEADGEVTVNPDMLAQPAG